MTTWQQITVAFLVLIFSGILFIIFKHLKDWINDSKLPLKEKQKADALINSIQADLEKVLDNLEPYQDKTVLNQQEINEKQDLIKQKQNLKASLLKAKQDRTSLDTK